LTNAVSTASPAIAGTATSASSSAAIRGFIVGFPWLT
jgi:hypothetical protein